jgi:type II secretory pathway pseudopilin PulG
MNLLFKSRRLARRPRRNEEGYILLTMMLAISLMAIAATALLPGVVFDLKRDQEQEMIHRGVQYSRAIRAYYKKFGRYPTRLEDLDNTNNLRYLRKHYKDPLNKNQDFRLLHYGDPDLKLAGSIGGGGIAGATPAGAAMNGSGASGGFGGFGGGSSAAGSAFGGSNFGSSLSGGNGVNSNGVFAQSSTLGGNSNGGAGANSNSQNANQQVANSGSESSDPNAQVAPGTAQGATSSSGQQVIASGPIVGVASISKKDTIREYNKKKKYNEWQFIYDPSADRGGLITTPYQPGLQTAGLIPGQNGQPGATNSNSPFGQSSSGQSSFGQPSGQSSFGQSTSFGQQSSFGPPSTPAPPPPTSSPQQQ